MTLLSDEEKQKRAAARKQNRADAVTDFDTLPDSAGVRVHVVAKLCGCSIPTVWRRARTGELPAPYKASEQVTIWNVGKLRTRLRELQSSAAA
jgi:predicted DNA-binding transcriptional regulator AlpA